MGSALRFGAAAAAVLFFGVCWAEANALRADFARAPALHEAEYVSSRRCAPCHPGNYASWHRSFHRTMTQEASASSVLGDFTRGELDYMGVHARMRRDSAGRFVIEWNRDGGRERWSAVVARTVGSRRYQQYLARDGDVYYRLPVAWNVEERRFMHMNGAFLTPDPVPEAPGAAVARADYDRHVTRWNDNCVYCHNVAPRAGLDPSSGSFDTRVAELGIACEACHGPASEHVARNRDPLRRFALHLGGFADPTIANPARMPSARSAEVCGHCHGQRIAPDIERVHREGDRFVPGDDLRNFSHPLARDTTLNGVAGAFTPRFWPSGTARLTAYEYQGLLQSACARGGELRCTSCHAMHDGDPRGQLRPERPGDALCTSCHHELEGGAAQRAHSHHGQGTRCVDCHMPPVVYGLVSIHRSHRIESPRATSTARDEPNACLLCHVDRRLEWVARELEGFGRGSRSRPSSGGDDTDALPEVTRSLLRGDPIERAVSAAALGSPGAEAAGAKAGMRAGLLVDTLERDDYPAVRAIAWRSLRAIISAREPSALPELRAFTATDESEQRRRSVAAAIAGLRSLRIERPAVDTAAQRADADATRIFIGE